MADPFAKYREATAPEDPFAKYREAAAPAEEEELAPPPPPRPAPPKETPFTKIFQRFEALPDRDKSTFLRENPVGGQFLTEYNNWAKASGKDPWQTPYDPRAESDSVGGSARAFARGFGQGATSNFMDEAIGAIRSSSYGPSYTEARDADRAGVQASAKEHPTAYRVGELVGGAAVPSGGLWKAGRGIAKGVKAVSEVPSVLKSIVAGAGHGAAQGGAAYLGAVPETKDVNVRDAAVSAAPAAALGGLAGGLRGQGQRNVYEAAKNEIAGVTGEAQKSVDDFARKQREYQVHKNYAEEYEDFDNGGSLPPWYDAETRTTYIGDMPQKGGIPMVPETTFPVLKDKMLGGDISMAPAQSVRAVTEDATKRAGAYLKDKLTGAGSDLPGFIARKVLPGENALTGHALRGAAEAIDVLGKPAVTEGTVQQNKSALAEMEKRMKSDPKYRAAIEAYLAEYSR